MYKRVGSELKIVDRFSEIKLYTTVGRKFCNDLETKLYSQFEENFLSYLKLIFVLTNNVIFNFLKNRLSKFAPK